MLERTDTYKGIEQLRTGMTHFHLERSLGGSCGTNQLCLLQLRTFALALTYNKIIYALGKLVICYWLYSRWSQRGRRATPLLARPLRVRQLWTL